MKCCKALFSIMFCSWIVFGALNLSANDDVDSLLNSFHRAAAEADYDKYFSLMSPEIVFMGTDASERWSIDGIKAFAKPYFDQGRGWLYVPLSRNITTIKENELVFFDELLTNKSYGTCRGSGVVIRTDSGWKILQYNLSIMVPNDAAKDVTQIIKTFEDKKVQQEH